MTRAAVPQRSRVGVLRAIRDIPLTSTRNFDIPVWRLVIVLAVSMLIGLSLYSFLMWWTLSGLKAAIRRADVFQTVLAQDPYQVQGVPGEPPLNRVVDYEQHLLSPDKATERRRRIVDLLQLLKVVDEDAATRLRAEPSFSATNIRLIADLFETREFGKRAFQPRGRSTVGLIVDAAAVGPSRCGNNEANFRSIQEQNLVEAIAQTPGPGFWGPGLGKHYVVQAAIAVDLDGAGRDAAECVSHFRVSWVSRALSYATFSPPETISDNEVLEALLTSFRLVEPDGLHWPGLSPPSKETAEDAEAKTILRKFLTSLLSELRADPGVRMAQLWVTVVRGWEQAGMCVLAVFVAWILWVRYRETKRELGRMDQIVPRLTRRLADRDIEEHRRAATGVIDKEFAKSDQPRSLVVYLAVMARNYASGGSQTERRADEFRAVCDLEARSMFSSGWPVRTALALIPALGFLGTVRGILIALADIDSIVRAGSPLEQAAAVSQIGTSLGLAFATTAVALVLGFVFRVISDYQTSREETLVQDCESTFTPLVDPTLGEQAA